MLTLDFDLEGEFELLSSHFEKVEGQLTVAIDRALRKLSNWFGSRLKREFAQALNLPKKILNTRFRKSYNFSGSERQVNIWIGLLPIDAAHAGKPIQNSAGVRVGKRFFPNAFIATMRNGKEGIFKRSPNAYRVLRDDGQWTELPIEKQNIRIEEEFMAVFERFKLQVSNRFKELLQHEIQFILSKMQ